MSEALTSLLAIPAVGAALAVLIGGISKALERRSRSWVAKLNAEAAVLDAEAQKMLAEARVRESQARITESDAQALRDALATATREREEDRKEMRAKSAELSMKSAELADAREEIRNVLQANEEERLGRARAEEHAMQMRRDFHAFNAEVRAGRPPRHTPPSFRVDTQPYGAQR
jgi:chromosome segregation ATPase